MEQKTKKILLVSFSCLIILCITIFAWVAVTMSRKSEDSITEIGKIYMQEMNAQLQQKFVSIVSLRLSQVEGIIERTNPETTEYGKRMVEDMALSAGVRNFSYLGMYTIDGEYETVYGEPIEIYEAEDYLKGVAEGGNTITSATNENGDKLMVLGVKASYMMHNGKRSTALIAAFPMTYLQDALVLDDEDGLIFTHIIRKDGSYVIRSGDAYLENFFDRVEEKYEELNGKTPEQFMLELQQALENETEYSTLIMADGVHRHIYCAPLPYCDWYYLSVMPYGVLDDAIDNLGSQRMYTIIGACSIILAAFIIIFIIYYRLSQHQLVKVEEAKQEAVRANMAKSEFLSNMSHDIRTPMNGIVGMTAIAMANIDDRARVKDCLKKITLSSKHLLGLISDVLDMSKIESGKLVLNMEQISLRETMDSLVNIIQPQINEKKQHFDILIQNIKVENVCCDGVRLNQVLINLLSNAMKFTPEGGRINMYLAQEDSPKGEDYVRCHFRVKDTGIGMSPEFLKKIYDTFTREQTLQVSRTEGTGLGMAITKCIVDAMEGTIDVQSEVGKGSQFHITLDMKKSPVQEEKMMLPGWNLLVVDNSEDLCLSAVSALEEIGVHADWALDGYKAVQMAREHHNRHDAYQFILLDWKMPDMDGLHTTREIRKVVGDEIPIFIISAYDWSDIEDEAREAGIQGFISKPLFKSNLYWTLKSYTKNSAGLPVTHNLDKHDFTGKRILLAEDNELNWEIAEEILSEVGFEVTWAENGQICVDKFKESEPGYYDALLMDIRMPVMNGYDAAKAIRALEREDANLPIIAMTADAFSDDIQRSLKSGMNAHIAKPIDINLLMQHLNKYL